MRIALDATYSLGRNLSGVGVYSREILSGLAAAHPEARFLFCYRPHRFFRSFAEALPANASRRMQWGAPLGGRAGLFHGLNQRIDSRPARRVVCTFHDLFVLTADYSTAEFRRRFVAQARQAAERSDSIVAVSAFTAEQVETLLGVERARIRVIHHGVRVPANPPPLAGRGKMVLFAGAIQRRKNIARLVEAFERMPPGWRLVLAGSLGFGSEEILARISASPRRADIELPGYVSEAALWELYGEASVFAFPSLDEGFGMPVLEAMAWGVPVITSNRSALPEVAGDAALLVDPFDTKSIADALRRVMEDGELRNDLFRRGRERALGFSWKTAVEKTWEVYRELVGEG